MKFYKIIKYYIAIIFVWPAKVIYFLSSVNVKRLIDSDIEEMNIRTNQRNSRGLLFWLIFHTPYRNLFYYRVGKLSYLIKWYIKPYPLFYIRVKKGIGSKAFVLNHPFGTIINANSIGNNFTICQLTTIGNKMHGRNDLIPTIGNNVSIGANVNIIGNVNIGDNVIIGAGTVVVKDIPNNSIVVGNPMKFINKNNL